MAGKNIILKPGQVLFKAGDASNGMYLVRSGELRVYLDQGNKEVALATVSGSGMIGEMALFDKKPRSASVRAMTTVEVTLISNDDFTKLMKQIPKWFVSLMGTLSGRLRETNDRLQKREGGVKEKPFETTLRILHVMALLWHKDGLKEGKTWQVEKKGVVETIDAMFHEDAEKLADLLKVIVNHDLIVATKSSYNAVVLAMANRAVLSNFIEFMGAWVRKHPENPFLPTPALEILETLQECADRSAYDTYTVSLEDLSLQGRRADRQNVDDWKSMLPLFKEFGDNIKLVKTSDGGIGFRTTKKEVAVAYRYHRIIAAMYEADLS